jgi:copper chaperone CopZ
MSPARPLALLCAPLLALGVSACASTASTSSFKGEQHAVAQVISNLQTEATADEAKQICASLLSTALTTRLNAARGGCTEALKSQLAEVDSLEVSVQSVHLAADEKTATARVKSTREGKKAISAVLLVKENQKWKISGLGG